MDKRWIMGTVFFQIRGNQTWQAGKSHGKSHGKSKGTPIEILETDLNQ